MNREYILKIIIEFFRKKGIEIHHDVDKVRYLEQGWLDSFDLIDFIVYLEKEFEIEFTPEDLQSEVFRTIGGVVDTILKKLN